MSAARVAVARSSMHEAADKGRHGGVCPREPEVVSRLRVGVKEHARLANAPGCSDGFLRRAEGSAGYQMWCADDGHRTEEFKRNGYKDVGRY